MTWGNLVCFYYNALKWVIEVAALLISFGMRHLKRVIEDDLRQIHTVFVKSHWKNVWSELTDVDGGQIYEYFLAVFGNIVKGHHTVHKEQWGENQNFLIREMMETLFSCPEIHGAAYASQQASQGNVDC